MNNFKLIIVFFILFVYGLFPGPTVIRDARITDLATTPALGRGYSISTGTFQSLCLQNVVNTKPSYNLRYLFEQIDENGNTEKTSKVDGKFSFSFRYFGFKGSGSGKGKKTTIEGKQYTNQRLRVTLFLDVYYASVDEAQTRMSSSAQQLLLNDDIPGFFNSCGPYYIRSLRRNSNLVSVFNYLSETDTRDEEFETQLQMSIRGWGYSASVDVSRSGSFKEKLTKSRLTISTDGFGLGKNPSTSLISYDLDSFRQAIKDAFLAMQDEYTGYVTEAEVVPWVENTDFQSLIKLKEEEIPVLDATGNPVANSKPEKITLYDQKRILNLNGEFLAEVDRVDRALLNRYYKAKLCREFVNSNYAQTDESGATTLSDQYKDYSVKDNKFGKIKKLEDLYKVTLDPKRIETFMEARNMFMYNSKDAKKNGGALGCITKMMEKGIKLRLYAEHAECKPIVAQLAVQSSNDDLDNFCMPTVLE